MGGIGDIPGLGELLEDGLLAGLDLLHLVSQPVLHVVATELHVRPLCAILESRLRQLARRDLLADASLQSL